MKKRMTPLGALLGTAALNMIASDTHRGAVKLPQPTFAAPRFLRQDRWSDG